MAYRNGVNVGGQPELFTGTVQELQAKIDKYFNDCKGTVLLNSSGDPVINKYGDVVMSGYEPLTITGLALAIGFNTRQGLLNYQHKDKYFDTIIHAKSIVQQFAETSLYSRERCNGAKFNLSNNFGWSEKNTIETNNTTVNTLDLSHFTVEQLKEMAKTDK